MIVSKMGSRGSNLDAIDEDPSFCNIRELPSLGCSIIEGAAGAETHGKSGGRAN
eukprot:CAMPEP_0185585798 /NCGR_PEP_ID=MMETSP0434-20130131/40925_1 /TAXON_ID=626734 ORGANISM="Favella taraikaensis, Strain Fe Narragansett Bay" /NCGR_SAMPLE_ID=MMETSP0434 /ASSEMBLY_ACC=CAM_ASM_000379 /LENGTH=53 /DNA_ID=CAMNT_0028206405 /DNA_START=930 /DNA_END=1091 /DNA_ORIENTATION=+